MGFQEEEILMALKVTGNNQEAAVSGNENLNLQISPKC